MRILSILLFVLGLVSVVVPVMHRMHAVMGGYNDFRQIFDAQDYQMAIAMFAAAAAAAMIGRRGAA